MFCSVNIEQRMATCDLGSGSSAMMSLWQTYRLLSSELSWVMETLFWSPLPLPPATASAGNSLGTAGWITTGCQSLDWETPKIEGCVCQWSSFQLLAVSENKVVWWFFVQPAVLGKIAVHTPDFCLEIYTNHLLLPPDVWHFLSSARSPRISDLCCLPWYWYCC